MPVKVLVEGKKGSYKNENLVPIPYEPRESGRKVVRQTINLTRATLTVEDMLKKRVIEDSFKGDSRSCSPTTSINSQSSISENGDSGLSSEQDVSPPSFRKTISLSTSPDSDLDSSSLSSDSDIRERKYRRSKTKTPLPDALVREMIEKAAEMKRRRQILHPVEKNAVTRPRCHRGRLSRLRSLTSIPQEVSNLASAKLFPSMSSISTEEDDFVPPIACTREYIRPLYEVRDGEASHGFAGISDIFSPQQDSTIKSAKGTVRGVKNRVRAGIATFTSDQRMLKLFADKERGKVVVYVTTLGINRETYERCLRIRKILWTLMVRFEEKDTFMSRENQLQVLDRTRTSNITVPHVFLEGQYLGGVELIEKLNETGELRRLLQPYMKPAALTTCDACGGFRLLPCNVCNGSKKSVHRNDFTSEFVALKCSACDESGLVQCVECIEG